MSTVDVYDRTLFRKSFGRISEESSLVRDSDSYYYARSKLFAERKVIKAGSKIQFTIVRPATIYGPRDLTIFPRVVEHLESSYSCLIKGFDPILGLVHVRDVADLCVAVSTCDVSNGEAYNASSNEDIRLREYIRAICSGIGLPLPKFDIPYIAANILVSFSENLSKLSGRKKEPFFTRGALGFFVDDQIFDISKAKRDTGWEPKVIFANGIREVIDDFLRKKGSHG